MVKLRRMAKVVLALIIFCGILIDANFISKPLEACLNKLNIEYRAYDNNKVLAADVGNNNDYVDPSLETDTRDYDDYNYRSNRSNRSYSSSSGSSLGTLEIIVLAGVVIAIVILNKKGMLDTKGKGGSGTGNGIVYLSPKNLVVRDNTREIVEAITETDPLFSAEKFLGWTQEVFMTLQEAWTERDWSKIRPFEKEELFKMHEKQLQEYIRMKRINVVERISINEDYLHKYERDAQFEYLQVYLSVAMNDYIVDEMTRKVIKGNENTRYRAKYLLTFMRKVGVITDPATSNMNTSRCPHCGAPIEITSAGKCEYCDTIVTTGDHDWVLSDLDCIKQDTQIGAGGVFVSKKVDS